ncbi:hypothetical protein CHS0354_027463 [Potamilus streckersoni]|uniref:Tubulin--tyrosine ligase n=1 Tax=Potamilus streckersoni TaxID=2493646 RepID=A0AAE0T689_9BIVA|nr:hypothetical protein CHS0354_027463 [Potamilus streckersoni]
MYGFVQRDKKSSVYHAVTEYLLSERRRDWRKLPSNVAGFHLMFGERNKLPFGRLGHDPGIVQLVNYYRGSDIICRKTAMSKVFKGYAVSMKHSTWEESFKWLPLTFFICPQTVSRMNVQSSNVMHPTPKPDERAELLKMVEELTQIEGKPVAWIAKSSAGAKGDGIKISTDVNDLVTYVDNNPYAFVIQRYIERPFLLQGNRKFDIRCWVLLDYKYDIYLLKEGVLRTASDEYKPDNYSAVTSHLTNHALQKELSKHFGLYEEGNEMFYEEFNRYLQDTVGVTMETTILPQVRDIIKKCFHVVKERIKTNGIGYISFQLFGFDFMLDEDLKVWLLEINGAPACAQKLLPDLARSIVVSAIDPVFPPSVPNSDGNTLFQKI